MNKTPNALEWAQLQTAYWLAEIAVEKALATPPMPPQISTEDWDRPDPNPPLPSWNLWGDAGLVTRKHPWQPYTLEHLQPVSTQ